MADVRTVAYRAPIQILLAEDNQDDAVLIEEILAPYRLELVLHVVRDGEEALAYLHREGPYRDVPLPSILLLDMHLPKKDGLQVLKQMKAEPGLKNIPVIVLTASNREEDIISSYAEGACSFITKPSSYEEFSERITSLRLYWTRVTRLPATPRDL